MVSAVVAHILAADPTQSNVNDGWTALHAACFTGRLGVVKQLLTVNPGLIQSKDAGGMTALNHAASNGHSEVVDYFLAEHPDSIDIAGSDGWTALHCAAFHGCRKVVQRLLDGPSHSASLAAVTAVDEWTALHCAAFRGHSRVVEYLLGVCPALIDVLGSDGQTALHCAASKDALVDREGQPAAGGAAVADVLLAVKPELISMKDSFGDTFLRLLTDHCQSREFLEKVWRLHPEALRATNNHLNTPLDDAVRQDNASALEVFQWSSTWEDIAAAHLRCGKSFEARFRPVMQAQCGALLEALLLPDVAGTVFEYLGFERVK